MENQLKNRELKHKKKQKGLSPFTKLDAGNVEYNVNTFNNSTMSEHIFNNPERYNLINRIRNEFNKNYKFDNYTTQQLFNILKKLEAEKEKSKIDKNNNFRHTLIDDPTFNFDDPDREGDYEVENINIREALNKLDRDSLEGNYQDLLNLYEAAQPRLTAQDKMELKKIISSTNDPEVIANALQTKVAKESMCEYYFTDEATLDEIARAFGTADFRINLDYIDYSMRPKDYNAKAISEDKIELNYICQEPFAQRSVDFLAEEIEEIFKDICAEANYIYPFDVKVNVKCRDYDYYNNQTFEDDGVEYLYEDNFILHINEREISESFKTLKEGGVEKPDGVIPANRPFTNAEIEKVLGVDNIEWEVEQVGYNYDPDYKDYKVTTTDGKSYIIRRMEESKFIKESLQKGDSITIWWKNPNWSTTSPSYASCTYVGRTNDGKYKFKSDTYGWIFIVDAVANTVTTPQGKEFELYNDSGWTRIFNESKSIKEDLEEISQEDALNFLNSLSDNKLGKIFYEYNTYDRDYLSYIISDEDLFSLGYKSDAISFAESFEKAMNESTCNYVDRYNNIVIYECDGKYIATAINGKSVSGKSVDDVKSQLDKIDVEYRKHFNDLEEDANVDYTYTLDDMADAISFAEADEEDKEVYYIDEANIPHNMRCKSFDTSVENDIVVLEWISMEGFTPEDFEQFKTEVQRVFSKLINITNYSEPFEVDIECSTRGYDANRFNPDNVNHQSATIKFNQSSNESLDEAFEQYDMRQGWTPEDIEKHKNIDWKELNYSDYEDTSDQFEYEVVLYDFNNRPERKTVLMSKYYRANSIFPPFYAPANNEKPFENAVGPMFDGDTRGNYDIHNRYETQEVYDRLSEDLNENTNTLDVEAQKVYDILKEYGASSIENVQGVYEIGFSDEINDATLILNQLESNGYEYIADYGNDVYIVDYIDESKKFNIKVVDGDKITVYVSVEESMNEDYQHEDDKWGNPFLVKDIERTLAEITDNFREKDGTVRTGYEEEKIIAKKVLEKHYDIVEVSDGRRYDNDDVTWVISYTSPKSN